MHHPKGPPLLEALSTAWMRKVTGKSGQAVADWRNGDIPESRLEQITDAVRALLPEYEEAPRPQWAEGLDRKLDRISAALGITPSDAELEALKEAEHEAGEGAPRPEHDGATGAASRPKGNG